MRVKATTIGLVKWAASIPLCLCTASAVAQSLPPVNPGDPIKAVDVNRIAQAIDARWEANGTSVTHRNGNVGIGPTNPGEKLHITDGHVLLEGGTGGSAVFKFKRDITVSGGPSGTSTNPIFEWGRIEQAGDLDPEFKVLYSDDSNVARSIFKLDRKGIIASVKTEVGSHFEGFIEGDVEPLFRLNSLGATSSPPARSMQLEMGPGGTTLTDVAVRRTAASTLSLLFGADVRSNNPTGVAGNVGIGTATPTQRLDVAGNVRAVGFIAGNTALNVPDYVFDNNYHLMSLVELRAYTMAEHHLPNVPSATDIRRDGVDLGQMQMKLLEKIEELTLYVLSQEETAHAQRARIDALETRLRELTTSQR